MLFSNNISIKLQLEKCLNILLTLEVRREMVLITLALIENLATPGHNSNCSMQKELHIYKVLRSRQSMCLLLFSAMLACHDWMI